MKLKIIHWTYGGSVEKIITFTKSGEKWESADGDISLEVMEFT
jgi:hypothetical protein